MFGFSPLSTVPFSSLSGKLLTAAVLEAINAINQETYQLSPGGVVTEAGTSVDSITNVKSSLGISSEGFVLDLWPKLSWWSNSTIISGYLGINFIAPNSTQLGLVKVALSWAGSAPTVNGELQLWQLASNSTSAIPQTLLATAPILASSIPDFNNLANLNNPATIDFTNVSGASVTAGIGYAIIIKADASWTTVRYSENYSLTTTPK